MWFIKPKILFGSLQKSLKDVVKEIKREATEWEKIFAKFLFDEGLACRIYKYLSQ